MKAIHRRRCAATAALAVLVTLDAATVSAQPTPPSVNVFTTREKDLVEPLLRVFEGLTSVKLNVVYLTGDVSGQLKAAVADGKADLFIAAEFSQLVAAKEAGLTAPMDNADIVKRVPGGMRDIDGHWFGLTRRVRVVAAARERVKQSAFTYEELADPKWKGKLCVRSGLHPYNVMLTASMIAHKGAAATEAWLRGMKANLAGKPAGGDRDQIAGAASGRCDVALVNTYYVGGMRSAKDNPQQQATGNAVNIMFPNVTDRGAHVSISGMALMKGGPGVNSTGLLMDFMTSEPAQFIYSQDNFEYPIRADVKPSGLVASWGEPKLETVALGELAKRRQEAEALIRKVGFDEGPGG